MHLAELRGLGSGGSSGRGEQRPPSQDSLMARCRMLLQFPRQELIMSISATGEGPLCSNCASQVPGARWSAPWYLSMHASTMDCQAESEVCSQFDRLH
jgi:hypothetical protein